MLPSRSRLQSWDPDSLSCTASQIRSAGERFYDAVRGLDDGIDAMPESQGWSGAAHTAAQQAFGRATARTSAFQNYTAALARALENGSASIGAARRELLAKADDVDSGPLRVTDQWVVMIDPAGMTAEAAADLQKRAEAAQAEVNGLLHAVGQADDATALKSLTARACAGAGAFGNPVYGPPGPLAPSPGDDVMDPATGDGRQFQEIARAQDMATTIRDVDEAVDRNGDRITTLTMLDGSTQVTTEYVDQGLPSQQVYPAGTLRVLHGDENGDWISDTMTIPREDGGSQTEVSWADGTHFTISRNPDGSRSGSCTTADGKHAVLPDSFFQDPLPTMAGGALSGLETQAGRGIYGLSAAMLDGLEAGAKWGGPAMGIAQAVLGVYTADTVYDQCVATWSGGLGVAGGVATTVAMGAIPGVGPIAAMGGNALGGFVFGYVGKLVGNVMCGP